MQCWSHSGMNCDLWEQIYNTFEFGVGSMEKTPNLTSWGWWAVIIYWYYYGLSSWVHWQRRSTCENWKGYPWHWSSGGCRGNVFLQVEKVSNEAPFSITFRMEGVNGWLPELQLLYLRGYTPCVNPDYLGGANIEFKGGLGPVVPWPNVRGSARRAKKNYIFAYNTCFFT